MNAEERIGIVSSKTDVQDRSEAVFGKMQRIVGQFLDKPLHNYGLIPADTQRSLSRAWNEPLCLGALPKKTVHCVAGISQSILQMNETTEDHPSSHGCSLAHRLFRAARNSPCPARANPSQ